MCFIWGLQDSGLNCLLRSILGFEFESKITPFSCFNFTQSLGIFVFQLIGGAVLNPDFDDDQLIHWVNIYLITVGSIGLISLIMMLFFKFNHDEAIMEIETKNQKRQDLVDEHSMK